jgi:hypothetical protein
MGTTGKQRAFAPAEVVLCAPAQEQENARTAPQNNAVTD